HIPADVCKPLIPAKQRTIRSQTSANRLWYPNNRQHARLPSSRFALCLLLSSFLISSSIVLGAAITLQVVLAIQFLDASQAQRQAQLQREEEARQRELDDARRVAEAEQNRADAERERAEAQTRAARRLRRLSAVLALVVLLAIIAGVIAWKQRQLAASHAQAAANLAQGRTLSLFESQLTHAAMLARVEDYAAVKTVL